MGVQSVLAFFSRHDWASGHRVFACGSRQTEFVLGLPVPKNQKAFLWSSDAFSKRRNMNLSGLIGFALSLLSVVFLHTKSFAQVALIPVAQTNNAGYASAVALSGNYVFLANAMDGVRVYGVSNPANPINIAHKE